MIYYNANEEHKVLMHTNSAEMAKAYKLTETCPDDGLETAWDGSVWVKGYAPEEPEAEKKAKRKAELIAELAQIDLESIRPTRAIQNGTATEFDTQKLAELEERAEQIRQEIRNLSEVKLDKEEEFD